MLSKRYISVYNKSACYFWLAVRPLQLTQYYLPLYYIYKYAKTTYNSKRIRAYVSYFRKLIYNLKYVKFNTKYAGVYRLIYYIQ